VLYVLLISPLIIGSSYTFWRLGYRWGRAAVSRVLASGWVQALTEGATVVGMIVLGALTSTVVRFSLPVTVSVGQAAISLQTDVFDAILLNLLPLALTVIVWRLLYLRVPSMRIIGGLFALGVVLTYLGLAGRSPPPLFSRDWMAYVLGGQPLTFASALAHLWPLLLTFVALVVLALLQRKRRLSCPEK
jgi:hypothetical protein